MPVTVGGTSITFNDATTLTTNPIPSGTVTNFYQASAPTGWTQVTTMNDYAMRIVSGSGGTTGGTTAFSTVFSNQTPTISVNVSGLSAGATTLSTAQMPSHTHTLNLFGNSCPPSGAYLASGGVSGSTTTNAQGGGGSHNHSISGSASGSSSAITLNVLYQNHILCSKN